MRGVVVAVVAGGLIALAVVPAVARPVRIGRYVELPYGVRLGHPYPTFAGDAARTGRSRSRAPLAEPRRIWVGAVPLPTHTPAEPVVTADGIVVVTVPSGLFAYVAADGRLAWQAQLGHVDGAPSLTPIGDLALSVTNGGLFLVSPLGEIRARGPESVRSIGSPLVLDDGSIVVAGRDRSIHRLDADARPIFRTSVSESVVRPPAWARDGRIVAVTADQRVAVVGLDGTARATVGLAGPALTPPAIADDGTVWIATREPALLAIAPDGTLRSRTELPGMPPPNGRLAIGRDGGVRVTIADGKILCVGPTGVERWRFDAQSTIETGVALDADDVSLVATADFTLRAIDAGGNERWRVMIGGRSRVAPVLTADGTVLVVVMRGAAADLTAWR